MAKRTPPRPAELRRRLLPWYRKNRRDLPWRRTTDPYAVWISEVMLQQTRVDTVIPYYQAFLERWPTVDALADADPDDVRAAWSGLGYYRRARAMLDAAATISRDLDATLPSDPAALRLLPGFGRYTAGAVASIAFGAQTPAVDGNVLRVLARIEGIEGDVSRGSPNKAVWARAEELVAGARDPGSVNQSLIELGATVCRFRNPECVRCPVRGACVARRLDKTHLIPPPKARAPRKRIDRTAVLLVERGPSIVLERQAEGGLFGGLWCLPMVEGKLDAAAALAEAGQKYGWDLTDGAVVADVKNVLTHRDVFLRIVRAVDRPRITRPLVRARLCELDDFGVPTFTVRALRASLTDDELAAATLPDRKSKRSSVTRR